VIIKFGLKGIAIFNIEFDVFLGDFCSYLLHALLAPATVNNGAKENEEGECYVVSSIVLLFDLWLLSLVADFYYIYFALHRRPA